MEQRSVPRPGCQHEFPAPRPIASDGKKEQVDLFATNLPKPPFRLNNWVYPCSLGCANDSRIFSHCVEVRAFRAHHVQRDRFRR